MRAIDDERLRVSVAQFLRPRIVLPPHEELGRRIALSGCALWALEEVVRRKNAELETLGALAWSSHPAIGRAKTALQRYPTVARALRRLLRGSDTTGCAR